MLKKILLLIFIIILGLTLYSSTGYNSLSNNSKINNSQINENIVQDKPTPISTYSFNEPFILIKKSKFKLYTIDSNNNVISEYDCALGKNKGQKEKEGDMKTPTGTFIIDEILDASYWTHDFKDGKGEIKGAYGPWFISIDTTKLSKGTWGGIGIHGTHDESSIGTLASEGCIRLKNKDIASLKEFSKINMKVVIEE